MGLHNSEAGYGTLTKTFHWVTVVLFAFQLLSANVMTRIAPGGSGLGLGQDTWYNWHKSIGLVALLVAMARIWARRQGELPPWAPQLSGAERTFVHRAEQVLYTAMFALPVSGFVYVMAGGYGVKLFGAADMPNPIGAWPLLALAARWTHVVAGWMLVLALAGHVGLVLRHQLVRRDGLLWRMWPR